MNPNASFFLFDDQIMARQGVKERHSFLQCILHVWCETIQIAAIVEAAYIGKNIPPRPSSFDYS
jgi:hypothetical protein